MKKLLIVYHSMTGGSLQMAKAAEDGAREESEVHTQILHASEVDPDQILNAQGYLFVTPETLGSMSGLMKDFFDRTYYQVIDQVQARPYAILICAGSDGTGAVRQIQRIATGWRLNEIAEPVIVCTHAQTPETILKQKTISESELQRCREVGQMLAAGMAMGMY